jgi:hypothetical protein
LPIKVSINIKCTITLSKILWRAAWKPDRRSRLAKHVSPATIGSADNRIAPVSIWRKRQHTSTTIGECYCDTTGVCWKRFRDNLRESS